MLRCLKKVEFLSSPASPHCGTSIISSAGILHHFFEVYCNCTAVFAVFLTLCLVHIMINRILLTTASVIYSSCSSHFTGLGERGGRNPKT